MKTIAGGALTIHLMSATAFAQTLSGGERSIDLTLGVKSTYQSNTSRSDTTSANARGLNRSDIRTTPNAQLDVNYPFGPHNLKLAASVGYDFYARNDRLNRERIGVQTGVGFQFPRCAANVMGDFQRRQSDLGEFGNVDGTGTTSVKNAETVLSMQASADCGNQVGFRPSIGAGFKIAGNSNTIRERNDHKSYNYSAGLIYQQPSIGKLQGFVQRSHTRYENRILPNGREEGYNTMSYGASYTRDMGSRLTVTGQIAYVNVNSRQALGDFKGMTWSLGAVGKPSSRMQVALNLSRQVSSSLAVDAGYHVDTTYQGSVNYAITDRLRVNASYQVRPRRFYGYQPLFGPPLRKDRVDQGYIGLTFDRNDRMSFNARVGRDHRSAAGSFYDYTSYLGELGVDMRF